MAPERFVTHHGKSTNSAKAAGGLLASAVLSSLPASCDMHPRSASRDDDGTIHLAVGGARSAAARAFGHGFRSERDAPADRNAEAARPSRGVVALPLCGIS